MAMIDIKALLLLPPENIKCVCVILVNWRGVSGERKNGHPFFVLDVGQMLIPSDGWVFCMLFFTWRGVAKGVRREREKSDVFSLLPSPYWIKCRKWADMATAHWQKEPELLSASLTCCVYSRSCIRAAAAGGGVGPAGSQSALAAPVRRLPGGVVVTYIIPTLSLPATTHRVCVCIVC
jgi:hypothetical protein